MGEILYTGYIHQQLGNHNREAASSARGNSLRGFLECMETLRKDLHINKDDSITKLYLSYVLIYFLLNIPIFSDAMKIDKTGFRFTQDIVSSYVKDNITLK